MLSDTIQDTHINVPNKSNFIFIISRNTFIY